MLNRLTEPTRGRPRQAASFLIYVEITYRLSTAFAFYQVESWDRTVFATIAVLLSITGVLAAFVPVRRATLVDPLEWLRYE